MQRYTRALFTGLVVLLIGASCQSDMPEGTATPIVHTVEIIQEVTRQVTREVTRVIQVPVTITPSPTLQYTLTPSLTPTLTATATITSTPVPTQATIREYANCLYGPSDIYLYKTSYAAGSRVEVAGRSWDALWINIHEVGGWNACWIPC